MNTLKSVNRSSLQAIIAIMVLALAGCASMENGPGKLMLSGDQEVPPVSTTASASGIITVKADKSVSGSVTTAGITATAAHIHTGARGQNGPVIVPLVQSGNTFSVPAGAMLTEAQYDLYKAGNLYVNVHSAAHKGGEIRTQLKP